MQLYSNYLDVHINLIEAWLCQIPLAAVCTVYGLNVKPSGVVIFISFSLWQFLNSNTGFEVVVKYFDIQNKK